MQADLIEEWFTYHPPTITQTRQYVRIRDEAKALAYTLQESCPTVEEYRLALAALRECVMWANASIACAQAIEGVTAFSPSP